MADSKNTPTLDYAKAREFAEWLAGDGAATTDGNGRNFARCYLEREALLGECKAICESLSLALASPADEFMGRCAKTSDRARALLARLSESGNK